MVPDLPTLTNNSVEVVVEPSSLLLQEMMVKLKKEQGENDEQVFQLVSYLWFRRTQNITELGLDYKEVGIYDIVVFFDVIY